MIKTVHFYLLLWCSLLFAPQPVTLTAGAIDNPSRRATFTATDNAGNTTQITTAGAISIDNEPPVVTDGCISIEGATSAGGVFLAIDEPEFTWQNNNPGMGCTDDNDDIERVRFNVFEFIDPIVFVDASEENRVWTAFLPNGIPDQEDSNNGTQVSAIDDAGNTTIVADTTIYTIDSIDPDISNVSTQVTNTTAEFTWDTNPAGSTLVTYGLGDASRVDDGETNTSPRVTSHTREVTDLLSCTLYEYQVSSLDASGNAPFEEGTIFTTGCTTTPLDAGITENPNDNGAPQSLTFGQSAEEFAFINPPINYSATCDAFFQIAVLNENGLIADTGPSPTGNDPVGAYELSAYCSEDTRLTSFDNPVAVTMGYQDADISGLDENSLSIYRWTGAAWTELSDCGIDAPNNEVTCDTSDFSAFAIFGDDPVVNNPVTPRVRTSSGGQTREVVRMLRSKTPYILKSTPENDSALSLVDRPLSFESTNTLGRDVSLSGSKSKIRIELAKGTKVTRSNGSRFTGSLSPAFERAQNDIPAPLRDEDNFVFAFSAGGNEHMFFEPNATAIISLSAEQSAIDPLFVSVYDKQTGEYQAIDQNRITRSDNDTELIINLEHFSEFVVTKSPLSQQSPDTEENTDMSDERENTQNPSAFTFKDIPQNEWFAPYVMEMYEKSIISGYTANGKPSGYFGPDNDITYAEILKIAYLSAEKSISSSTTGDIANTSARGHWAQDYVAQAEQDEISVITPSMNIDSFASRAHVITILMEVFEQDITSGQNIANPYTDISATHPQYNAIMVATELGIVQGDGTAPTVRPDATIKRAEVAKLVSELL